MPAKSTKPTKSKKKNVNTRAVVNDRGAAADGAPEGWNVLVYMAADNNLKEESVYSLTEIREAIRKPELTVTVQLDSGDAVRLFEFEPIEPDDDGLGTFGIQNENGATPVKPKIKPLTAVGKSIISNPKILQRLSDAEMLEEFVNQKLSLKKNNLVVLSGHGSGAVGDFMTTNNPPNFLSIPDIRSVLSEARGKIDRKIEILGMDSCLMSMVEVCYELREEVQFLIGAEGFARNAGWPYRQILRAMQKDLTIAPKNLARKIVDQYIDFYSPYTMSGVSVDQSVCDLSQMNTLKDAVLGLADMLRDRFKEEVGLEPENRKIESIVLLAHWRAQSYKLEQYIDLWDFCSWLAKYCNEGDPIREKCQNVHLAINGKTDIIPQPPTSGTPAILLSCYSGGAFQYSKGLSIYFPWAKSDLDRSLPFYKELSFARDTHWADFLAIYGEQTQRKPNEDKTNKSAGGDKVLTPMSVEIEIGLGFLEGVRTNRLENTKTNRLENTKGGRAVFPMVKNPPDKFLKFDDDCVLEEEKTFISPAGTA